LRRINVRIETEARPSGKGRALEIDLEIHIRIFRLGGYHLNVVIPYHLSIYPEIEPWHGRTDQTDIQRGIDSAGGNPQTAGAVAWQGIPIKMDFDHLGFLWRKGHPGTIAAADSGRESVETDKFPRLFDSKFMITDIDQWDVLAFPSGKKEGPALVAALNMQLS
jgi:hypothetical protein